MLHPFRYYAYCYALLCFLHQQQQAAALAIILDGATTNEWATRDEYQRLVEQSAGTGGANQQQQAGALQESLEESARRQTPLIQPQQQQQPDGERQAPLQVQVQVPAALQGPIMELLQERQVEGEALAAVEQLESALERLDLIEKHRQKVSGTSDSAKVVLPVQPPVNRQFEQRQLSRARNRANTQSSRGLMGQPATRITLNDLVPQGDRSRNDPLRQLKARSSTAQKYCGQELMNVLELVCQGRYYGGEARALTVDPTIKSKRFKRGATAECCHRPCHLDELKPYCEP